MQLYLDCDGVLADFDKLAESIFKMPSREYEKKFGENSTWKILEKYNNFFGSLELMQDAMELYSAVKHLNPIILTGCHEGEWIKKQKLEWKSNYFPYTNIIMCPSKDKKNYCKPGDIIIDDYLKYKNLWEDAGGIFIHHTSAKKSLEILNNYL